MAETDEINEFGREPGFSGPVSDAVYTLIVLICYICVCKKICMCVCVCLHVCAICASGTTSVSMCVCVCPFVCVYLHCVCVCHVPNIKLVSFI